MSISRTQVRTEICRAFIAMFACVAAHLSCAASVFASTILIDTSHNEYRPGLENQGWWPPTIGYSNNTESDFHMVGWSTPGFSDTEVRSFFSFYLDPLLLDNQIVSGARFIVRKGDNGGDASQETLGFFDVTSPLATVMHNVSTNFSVWSDLGGGISYGSATFSVDNNFDEILSIPLDAAAIAAINDDLGDYFTMGATITSGDGFVFRDNPGSLGIQALELQLVPVPEPRMIGLMAIVLAVLACARIRAAQR